MGKQTPNWKSTQKVKLENYWFEGSFFSFFFFFFFLSKSGMVRGLCHFIKA
jgi:ribonucleotide reductase beta subunit family protein with ferritin-like domain